MSLRAPVAVGVATLSALALAAAVRAQEQSVSPPPQAAPATPPPASVAPPPEEAPPPPPEPEAPVAQAPPAAPAPPPKPPEPLKRARHDAAILQAVDKITAESLRFEARVGAPVRFKDLVITVRACETSADDEPVRDSIAHLDVISQPAALRGKAATARSVYRGWMFAGSPGLHPFEHPVYDLWLIACRTTGAGASGGKA